MKRALHAHPFSLALTVLLLNSAACKPEIRNAQIKNSNIDALNLRKEKAEQSSRKGLTPKDVESIIGQPDRVENATLELETQKKQIPVTRYYYQQDQQVLELHFIDNKLINRVPHWPDPPAKNSQPQR
ncbi:MAG: hypothetical protein RLZZ142_2727 [Verrucomicrobiota bacterium]|jgi:hypothetical protein